MAETTTRPTSTTRGLLACGVIGGPLFIVVVLIQQLTREGFDPRQHALSQLSLGDLGWLQITNFIVTGLLFLACAVGMRRVLRGGPAGTWGPRLFGAFGAALIWGGVFVTDPAFGFPPGTPAGAPEEFTWHGILHGLAPTVAAIAIVAACFVFARRFSRLGERAWLWYSVIAAAGYLLLAFASFPLEDFRLMLAGGILAWTWASAIALRLLLAR
ncbi:DUF998 domain-containing protein [Natronosporangium hydrolyticum]|uniref:DUF998 domain-containing protein n=1 Tax=Natronosporangium hydrolyticum TaxID=2811111 RepID=A0A895YRV1_9ACTN|nr:DUF998 domain-containing protein [Natronosporangium hydrolyticum]QSB16840.1 DUF998 domain-containing protein [Natronosporangium hydrolyticum]